MPIPRNLSLPGGAARYTILRCSPNCDANPDPQPDALDYPGSQKRFGEMLIGSELGGMMRVRPTPGWTEGEQNPDEYIPL